MVGVDFSQVKLRYAKRGDKLVSIREFDGLRGTTKGRPTDLTCPECDVCVVPVLAKPPEHKITDHFRHESDADCVISRSGESATHFNAKAFLSQRLNQFHRVSLVYQCAHCKNWYSFFRIDGYDYAKPELKVAGRRPDVSCIKGAAVIGAAEIRHTHAVDLEKKRDLDAASLRWFEAAAASVLLGQCFKHIEAADILSIDAVGAGITYPVAPTYCEACAAEMERRRKTAASREAERAQFQRVSDLRHQRERELRQVWDHVALAEVRERAAEERRRQKSEWARLKATLNPDDALLALGVMLEKEGLVPEVDQYGIRLTPKISDALYVAIANHRRSIWEQTKKKSAQIED